MPGNEMKRVNKKLNAAKTRIKSVLTLQFMSLSCNISTFFCIFVVEHRPVSNFCYPTSL